VKEYRTNNNVDRFLKVKRRGGSRGVIVGPRGEDRGVHRAAPATVVRVWRGEAPKIDKKPPLNLARNRQIYFFAVKVPQYRT
jgi:hypothetical protein